MSISLHLPSSCDSCPTILELLTPAEYYQLFHTNKILLTHPYYTPHLTTPKPVSHTNQQNPPQAAPSEMASNVSQARGGVALDINVGPSSKEKGGKALPKGLSDRLSKRMQEQKQKRSSRSSNLQPRAKPTSSSSAGRDKGEASTRRKDGSRAPIRVNPVTGKMRAVEAGGDDGDEEMVREGCMMIPKKYLTAATDAGLGSSNGMYSNMSGMRRALNGASGATGSSSNQSGRPPRYTRSVSRVGNSNVHSLGASTSSRPRNNIKQVVQGRSRSLGTHKQNQIHESSFGRQKGVVNTFGGAKAVRNSMRRSDQSIANDKRKTGIASIGTSGGRSFVKMDSSKKANGATAARASKNTEAAKETTTITRKLGGQASTSRREDRERRAAHFAKLLSK